MKKVISILLVLVIALSLCACGGKGKYVGTYTSEGHFDVRDGSSYQVSTKLVINSDGTGSLVATSLDEDDSVLYGKYELNVGDVFYAYELTWEESDGYLIINGTGKRYYKMGEWSIEDMVPEGTPVTLSESYELKGNQLFQVGRDYVSYTKTN